MRKKLNDWANSIHPFLVYEITWQAIKETALILFWIIFVVYGLTVAWWLLYPYKPITVKSIVVKNPDKQVLAGSVLKYRITYDKRMDIQSVLTRKLINNVKIDLADTIATAPVGDDSECVYVKVPHYTDPGIYYLWWSAKYKVNPIREVVVSAKSDVFTVINAGK
jgi:hypothetical protein